MMRQRRIVFRHVYIIVNIQRNLFTRCGLVFHVDNNKPKAERNSSRIGHSAVAIYDKKKHGKVRKKNPCGLRFCKRSPGYGLNKTYSGFDMSF